MKKFLILAAALATTVASWSALPILVGHRGSSYGVENSVESFTNGAKLGYKYLETDFKVTKDKQLVCTHDDDISRLGGSSLTIAGSTLAELQAVPFTQTRNGVTYTGRLCSAQEYLDVCKEQGVRPLIELKWATGINSNDCSNIPMLIDFIERNGFRNTCIILTSMKPCLEYIRKNYPDIELQFLTGQYWANHFDWCVEQKIDVDIQAGYFDASTVKKFHDAGLKVNMWTTNTQDGYKQYGNWGCDFITTDNLDGNNLPELDSKITFPENFTDFPENTGKVKGFYNPEKVLDAELPAQLKDITISKAVMGNGVWYVLGTDKDYMQHIYKINAVTGEHVETLNLDLIDGSIGDIAVTADGHLLGCTRATVPFEASEDAALKFYTWTDGAGSPQLFFAVNHASNVLGNWTSADCGKVMTVSGKLNDMMVYVSTISASGSTYRIAGLTVKNGVVNEDSSFYCFSNDYTKTAWGNFSMTVTPRSRENILINSTVMQPVEYTFNWAVTRNPMTEFARPAQGLLPDLATGISYLRQGPKVYALIPACSNSGSDYTATIYDITDGLDQAIPASAALHEGLTKAAGYNNTAFSRDGEKVYAHLFTNEGMATFLLDTQDPTEEKQDVALQFTLDWIKSDVTENKPEHLDGTNAQQGTAVNGTFYIHDRVDKKIYVFTEDGLQGTLEGSTGYGCARDDAGNIIIRSDTQTGTEHSFIIYPAGATPANPGTPVSFSVTVPLSGQTNFINASGDLLGSGGNIYLYPSGQSAVNIIAVSAGKVLSVTKSEDLMMAGTTAGYVAPINNNSLCWLYQVRGVGIYKYDSGSSTAISTDRASTTPPARNSTGGMAYFSILGNTILVHNSGANYRGGFTVRNLSTNEVIKTIEPIGNIGYATGGNYSTFNWLIPEKVDDNTYRLYQYCPSGGIAMYTLRNTAAGVDNISTDDSQAQTMRVSCTDGVLSVSGVAVEQVSVYSIAGVLVASGNGPHTNVSSLPSGIYIAKVNNSLSAKFHKN